ncbi:MAG: hypothetical protein IJS15_15875, partial [Victivallales bacterium]|nr:hypothetical protein [Victivallales bacterium]
MKHFLLTALIALQALGVAAILRSQWRRGVYNDFITRWRGMSLLMRALIIVLVSSGGAYAANKLLGNRLHEMLSSVPGTVASLCTNVFTTAERQTGYAASGEPRSPQLARRDPADNAMKHFLIIALMAL